MTSLAPIMEWRNAASPNAVVTSVAISGSGYNGAIPTGTSSTPVTLRLYNNFANASNIADALNCRIACYDDTVHQGVAVNPPALLLYVSIQVTDYNGLALGADTQHYGIGGGVKHAIPTNGGTISGTGSNYVSVSLQVSVPANATQGGVSQGVWLEYSSTA